MWRAQKSQRLIGCFLPSFSFIFQDLLEAAKQWGGNARESPSEFTFSLALASCASFLFYEKRLVRTKVKRRVRNVFAIWSRLNNGRVRETHIPCSQSCRDRWVPSAGKWECNVWCKPREAGMWIAAVSAHSRGPRYFSHPSGTFDPSYACMIKFWIAFFGWIEADFCKYCKQ